jgi:membrane associated rhomboid family serine protease
MNQVHAPQLSQTNKWILIATGVLFLVSSVLKAVGAFSLVKVLGLSADGLMSGMVYQLLTYPLIETQLMGFIFNGLLLWFIGSELEAHWGTRFYLKFLLINIIAVGLVLLIISLLFFHGTSVYFSKIHGLAGINFSILVAYATLYPDRPMLFMMIFPLKSKHFCWLLILIEAYMAVFNSFSNSWAHLSAMGASFLLMRFKGRLSGAFRLMPKKKSSRTKQGHLYVVKDDDKNPPKYWQ